MVIGLVIGLIKRGSALVVRVQSFGVLDAAAVRDESNRHPAPEHILLLPCEHLPRMRPQDVFKMSFPLPPFLWS